MSLTDAMSPTDGLRPSAPKLPEPVTLNPGDTVSVSLGSITINPRDDQPRLSVSQAAALVGVAPSTWRAYVARGHAPPPDGRDMRSGCPWWHDRTVTGWQAARVGSGHRQSCKIVGSGYAQLGGAGEDRPVYGRIDGHLGMVKPGEWTFHPDGDGVLTAPDSTCAEVWVTLHRQDGQVEFRHPRMIHAGDIVRFPRCPARKEG